MMGEDSNVLRFPGAALIVAGALLGAAFSLSSPTRNLLTIGGGALIGVGTASVLGNIASRILSQIIQERMSTFRKRLLRLLVGLAAYELVLFAAIIPISILDPALSLIKVISCTENVAFLVLQFFIVYFGYGVWTDKWSF